MISIFLAALNPLLLYINNKLHWPIWTLQTVALLSLVALCLFTIQTIVIYVNSNRDKELKRTDGKTWKFRKFQLHYLVVFFFVMLADWLQGTNMYTLYLSYNVNVGALFLTGFLSSALFGTFLGIYIDKWGRRYGCLLFCILEVHNVNCDLYVGLKFDCCFTWYICCYRLLLIVWSISLTCQRKS